MKKIEDKYKQIDQISHILLRSPIYIGSNKPSVVSKFLYNDGKMQKADITYIPSFLKIFDEVVTNAIDEHKRNPEILTKLEVSINNDVITVRDDGGIPCEIHPEYGIYLGEMLFGSLMSSSNYDDTEERLVAGVNGIGVKCTNIFSKEFKVSSCDGKNLFTQTFTNNMRERTKPEIKKSKKNHTEISYLPDYERFGLTSLDDSHFKLIQKRVIDIAGCNPSLKVLFNGEEIKIKSFEDYVKMYTDEYYFETSSDKSWSIAVAPSNAGFQQISFVNSVETSDGGTHVDYILNQIITQLREFFQKRHKVDVKPSELKNHLFLFINSTIVNPSFSSQTKEKLITEIKDFGFTHIVSEKIIKNILKSEIINSILDWVNQKKVADESKLARDLNRNLSKIKVDKLIDAKGRDRWKCSLGIFEGDSAVSAFRKYRAPEIMGAFALKGKFINVSDISTKKLVENNEALNLMAALGLKLGEKPSLKSLRYGRIFLYTDADCLEKNTLIMTKSGNKKISEITYDDEILTHSGRYKKVKNIIQKDISKYIKIIISGNTILCSEDHKLIVMRNGQIIEIKAKDVKYTDFFLLKRKN